MSLRIILPIALTALYGIGLLVTGQWSKKIEFAISKNNYISGQFNYQVILLLITAISIASTYLLNKQNFVQYFSWGNISATGQELKAFGINKGDSWMKTGISLCIVISLATSIFLYFQLKKVNPNWSVLQSGIFWIILFSLTNSFSEEMIFRFGIVSTLDGKISPTTIFLISGILFGIPHFAGMPNGIIGVTMAGVLGFVLAKSMQETHGFFWAWLIHFIQDVLIITTLFIMQKNSN